MCPLLMMHKTCSINYGHLVDLQKTLPTIDLTKKNLSFDKISPRDFYFCPFFSICTCPFLWLVQVCCVREGGSCYYGKLCWDAANLNDTNPSCILYTHTDTFDAVFQLVLIFLYT